MTRSSSMNNAELRKMSNPIPISINTWQIRSPQQFSSIDDSTQFDPVFSESLVEKRIMDQCISQSQSSVSPISATNSLSPLSAVYNNSNNSNLNNLNIAYLNNQLQQQQQQNHHQQQQNISIDRNNQFFLSSNLLSNNNNNYNQSQFSNSSSFTPLTPNGSLSYENFTTVDLANSERILLDENQKCDNIGHLGSPVNDFTNFIDGAQTNVDLPSDLESLLINATLSDSSNHMLLSQPPSCEANDLNSHNDNSLNNTETASNTSILNSIKNKNNSSNVDDEDFNSEENVSNNINPMFLFNNNNHNQNSKSNNDQVQFQTLAAQIITNNQLNVGNKKQFSTASTDLNNNTNKNKLRMSHAKTNKKYSGTSSVFGMGLNHSGSTTYNSLQQRTKIEEEVEDQEDLEVGILRNSIQNNHQQNLNQHQQNHNPIGAMSLPADSFIMSNSFRFNNNSSKNQNFTGSSNHSNQHHQMHHQVLTDPVLTQIQFGNRSLNYHPQQTLFKGQLSSGMSSHFTLNQQQNIQLQQQQNNENKLTFLLQDHNNLPESQQQSFNSSNVINSFNPNSFLNDGFHVSNNNNQFYSMSLPTNVHLNQFPFDYLVNAKAENELSSKGNKASQATTTSYVSNMELQIKKEKLDPSEVQVEIEKKQQNVSSTVESKESITNTSKSNNNIIDENDEKFSKLKLSSPSSSSSSSHYSLSSNSNNNKNTEINVDKSSSEIKQKNSSIRNSNNSFASSSTSPNFLNNFSPNEFNKQQHHQNDLNEDLLFDLIDVVNRNNNSSNNRNEDPRPLTTQTSMEQLDVNSLVNEFNLNADNENINFGDINFNDDLEGVSNEHREKLLFRKNKKPQSNRKKSNENVGGAECEDDEDFDDEYDDDDDDDEEEDDDDDDDDEDDDDEDDDDEDDIDDEEDPDDLDDEDYEDELDGETNDQDDDEFCKQSKQMSENSDFFNGSIPNSEKLSKPRRISRSSNNSASIKSKSTTNRLIKNSKRRQSSSQAVNSLTSQQQQQGTSLFVGSVGSSLSSYMITMQRANNLPINTRKQARTTYNSGVDVHTGKQQQLIQVQQLTASSSKNLFTNLQFSPFSTATAATNPNLPTDTTATQLSTNLSGNSFNNNNNQVLQQQQSHNFLSSSLPATNTFDSMMFIYNNCNNNNNQSYSGQVQQIQQPVLIKSQILNAQYNNLTQQKTTNDHPNLNKLLLNNSSINQHQQIKIKLEENLEQQKFSTVVSKSINQKLNKPIKEKKKLEKTKSKLADQQQQKQQQKKRQQKKQDLYENDDDEDEDLDELSDETSDEDTLLNNNIKMEEGDFDSDSMDSSLHYNNTSSSQTKGGYLSTSAGGTGVISSASSSFVNSESLFDLMMSSKNRDSYFWQYNIQSKGPKTKKVLTLRNKDPHLHRDFFDPVFQLQSLNARGGASLNKLRKGDGNDVTPNAEKLYNLGNQIRDFIQKSFQMNSACFSPPPSVQNGSISSPSLNNLSMTPTNINSNNVFGSSVDKTANLPPTKERANLKREKNKIASRACRLKKKAQHEANKIKLFGLNEEHKQLIDTINSSRELIRTRLTEPQKLPQDKTMIDLIDEIIKQKIKTKVAGNTDGYVHMLMLTIEKLKLKNGVTKSNGKNNLIDLNQFNQQYIPLQQQNSKAELDVKTNCDHIENNNQQYSTMFTDEQIN